MLERITTDDFGAMAEKLREELNECAFITDMDKNEILDLMKKMTSEDKTDLMKLLSECTSEEMRFRVTPLDMRKWTFFFHEKNQNLEEGHFMVEGEQPDVAPFNKDIISEFTQTSGGWSLSVDTIKTTQRGHWCVKQNATLSYKNVLMARIYNDSPFFMDSVVVSPAIGMATAFADCLNEEMRYARVRACGEDDFACIAAFAESKKRMILRGSKPEDIDVLTEKFKQLERTDTTALIW